MLVCKDVSYVTSYSSTCKVYSASSVNKTDGYIDESVSVIESARAPYGSSKLIGELYSH